MSATQVHTELGHMSHGGGLVPGGDPLIRRGPGTNPEGGIAHELGMLLRGRASRFDGNLMGSRDIPQRSGSAPPSVEGSIAAMGGLFARHPASLRDGPGSSSLSRSNLGTNAGGSGERGDSMTGLDSEQELLKDPAYLAYYYSHINLNPRLPPPLISWESYRLAQRYQAGSANGGLGDGQMGKLRSLDDTHSKSLFSSQQMLPTHREEREEGEDEDRSSSLVQSLGRTLSSDWTKDGLMGLQSTGLGARPKSLVDLIQEDFPRTPSPVYSQRVPSRVGTDDGTEAALVAEMQLSHLRETMSALSEHTQLGVNGISNINGSGNRSGASTPNPVSGLTMSNAPVASNAHMAAPIARIPSPSPLSQVTRATSPGIVGERMPGTEGLAFGRSASMSRVEGGSASELAAALQRLEFNQHDRRKPSSAELAEAQQRQQLQQLEQLQQMQAIRAEEQQRAQEQEHQARIQREQDQQEQQQRLQQAHQAQQVAAAAAAAGGVPNMYAAAAAMYNQALAGNPYYQNMMYAPQYAAMGLNYPMSPALLNPMIAAGYHPSGLQMGFDNTPTAGLRPANGAGQGVGMGNPPGGIGMHSVFKFGAGAASGMAPPQTPMGADPLYFQYLQQRSAEEARLVAGDPSAGMRGYAVGGHVDILDLQKGAVSPIYGSPEQRSPYTRSSPVGVPMPPKQQANSPSSMSPIMSPGYYGSSPPGLVVPYPPALVGSPVMTPAGPLSPLSMAVAGGGVNPAIASGGVRRDERGMRVPSGAGMYAAEKGRSTAGVGANYAPGWQGAREGPATAGEDNRGSSLLEEFKSNKTRRFELSDIVGHVVEFSADQHGSRFIQQKLETATLEEKAMVFDEVIPRAITLMTDVFGNYVIQKFFEHGTPQQRKELAQQLVGHVLALSLQMYGCRVIQKALEVVDPDMQGVLVSELDGHVMRCVRDQNGNHVVQKCIECVPAARIQFIVSSFHNQVVALSTHPYGCRVIQRVLEHCSDDQKQRGIMDEILRSTCTLAQDQYGNYVVQHVLEHGNAAERGEIIRKLAGNIVQMSQHKFASNVVEKCLEFGSAADRQILISEMLGVTEENEPLQAMMKDQFANYVVQKVLETCDEQQRAMLLDRIKVHLHALKKYTYGKHIVARVEKLVAAGGKMQARDQAAAARREREHADRDSPREILI